MSDVVTEVVGRYLKERLGVDPQRASVTFLGVEPIDVLRFAAVETPAVDTPAGEIPAVDALPAGQVLYVTSGCARHPMADPTDLHADPVRGPRAELVVRMRAGVPLPGLHKRMATMAAAPAVEGLILAADALVDLGEPLWDGAAFTAVLLEADDLGEIVLPEPMDPVRMLRAVPITANEAAWVRLKGADALRDAWREAGIDVTRPDRAAATPS
nr:suppressor of fused domain protein [Gordonia jinghuaiqii]